MTCEHGFIGACAECDGCGQQPGDFEAPCPTICLGLEGVAELDAMLRVPEALAANRIAEVLAGLWIHAAQKERGKPESSLVGTRLRGWMDALSKAATDLSPAVEDAFRQRIAEEAAR